MAQRVHQAVSMTEGVPQFNEAPPQYFYENKALFQNR